MTTTCVLFVATPTSTLVLFVCTTLVLFVCTTLVLFMCTTLVLFVCTTLVLFVCTTLVLFVCTTGKWLHLGVTESGCIQIFQLLSYIVGYIYMKLKLLWRNTTQVVFLAYHYNTLLYIITNCES